MTRREDRKQKEPKQPKDIPLTPERKKEKLREEIREKFRRAFGHEDEKPGRRQQ